MMRAINFAFSGLRAYSRKDDASSRKLAAFTVIFCIVWAHVSWLKNSFMNNDFRLFAEILIIDFGFVSVALGLTTIENIAKLKNKKQDEKDKTISESVS